MPDKGDCGKPLLIPISHLTKKKGPPKDGKFKTHAKSLAERFEELEAAIGKLLGKMPKDMADRMPFKVAYMQKAGTNQKVPTIVKNSDHPMYSKVDGGNGGGSGRRAEGAGKGADIPPAFKQTEFSSSYEARLNQTPAPENPKVGFEGTRGESLCTLKPPPDPQLKQILDEAGIDGIQYKNAVPDLSPVAKAEVEIEYMLGGKGTYGGKARRENFIQSDQKLAEQLNKSPELARQFGMESGRISAKDIKIYRQKNKLTWHELNDVKTMQLVPTTINSTFGHLGGVGEINAGAGAFEPGGFATKQKEEIVK